jgi:hypothetical protein
LPIGSLYEVQLEAYGSAHHHLGERDIVWLRIIVVISYHNLKPEYNRLYVFLSSLYYQHMNDLNESSDGTILESPSLPCTVPCVLLEHEAKLTSEGEAATSERVSTTKEPMAWSMIVSKKAKQADKRQSDRAILVPTKHTTWRVTDKYEEKEKRSSKRTLK